MERSSLHEDNKLRKSNYCSTKTLILGTNLLIDNKGRHISTSGLVQNAKRYGCNNSLLTFSELQEQSDEQLFSSVV